jgi:hypothetical protein
LPENFVEAAKKAGDDKGVTLRYQEVSGLFSVWNRCPLTPD